MRVEMVDVSWQKIFQSHFGNADGIGEALMEAQEECFLYEDHGTCLCEAVAKKILGDKNTDYPILGPNTTQEDYKEAQFVMQNPACTLLELERERMKPEADRWKDSGRSDLGGMHQAPGHQVESLTETATRLKEQLARSVDRTAQQSGKGMLLAEGERTRCTGSVKRISKNYFATNELTRHSCTTLANVLRSS